MIESFPFRSTDDFIEDDDFSRFSNAYAQLVVARIPSSGKVYFIGKGDQVQKLYSDPKKDNEVIVCCERMLQGELTSAIVADCMLLAFKASDNNIITLVVSKVDSLLVLRAAEDWLEETRDNLLREFILVKQAYRDPETGMLNSAHLFSVLQAEAVSENIAVILVELPSRSRALRDAFRNAQRAAASLVTFTDSRFLIHHLGQCVFALLVRQNDVPGVEEFSSGLVHFLKKENFYRVHIGSSRASLQNNSLDEDCKSRDMVLDQAWTALQTAARRGPFSFCDYSLLTNVDTHPLRPATSELTKEFRRINRKNEIFSLVKIHWSDEVEKVGRMERELHLPEPASMFGVAGDNYIYIPGYDSQQGLQYARDLLASLGNVPAMSEVYAGVSTFPFHGFSRPETLANARKAMLHAAFFGPGHAVMFDAVSLNISGDIYFSDGDLPKAVKEYRLGLGCDPQDVNLLNSLGVTYALLNKNTLARRTFENVLEVDDHNNMALYNLGIGAQLRGELPVALECFEKAYEYCDTSEEGQVICRDLKVQLGQLYCQTGNYQMSLEYLEEWRKTSSERQQGRIFRYLGEAYLESGNPQEAMTWLQRALQQNELDHDTLSLLGTAIWKAREGDDIAIALCSKGVELVPDNPLLRVRLAKVQMHTGQYESALANLGQCRGKNVNLAEVQLLKANIYQKLQQFGRAGLWAQKVLQKCGTGSESYRKAKVLLESIQ